MRTGRWLAIWSAAAIRRSPWLPMCPARGPRAAYSQSGSITFSPNSHLPTGIAAFPGVSSEQPQARRGRYPGLVEPPQAARPAAAPDAPAGRPIADSLCSAATRCDARLEDVCFVDPQHGWTVGDQGAIWRPTTAAGTGSSRSRAFAAHCTPSALSTPKSAGRPADMPHPLLHTGSGVLLERAGRRAAVET